MHNVRATTSFFVGECVSWQFHNSSCNYSLSIVNFLERQLQAFTLTIVIFKTVTFSKGLEHLCSFGVLVISFGDTVDFGNSYCQENLFEVSNCCEDDIFFFKTPVEMVILYSSLSFYSKRGSNNRSFIFLTVLDFLEDQFEQSNLSWRVIFLTEQLQPCILSDGSYLLITATFLEELSKAFLFFKASLLISPLKLQSSIP